MPRNWMILTVTGDSINSIVNVMHGTHKFNHGIPCITEFSVDIWWLNSKLNTGQYSLVFCRLKFQWSNLHHIWNKVCQ